MERAKRVRSVAVAQGFGFDLVFTRPESVRNVRLNFGKSREINLSALSAGARPAALFRLKSAGSNLERQS
jgi:hypothetical protein